MLSVIQPLQPNGDGWQYRGVIPKSFTGGFDGKCWIHRDGFLVISAVEVARDKNDIDVGPCYHVSISMNGQKRCSAADALWVLNQFGIPEAEEDNHVPNGFVRNFWRPVNDNLVGHECQCKDNEPAIKEDKGDYIWRGVTK